MTVLLSHKHRGEFAYELQGRAGECLLFSGVVLVDGRPERSSSSKDFRPFLKRLYHKKFALAHDIISKGFL